MPPLPRSWSPAPSRKRRYTPKLRRGNPIFRSRSHKSLELRRSLGGTTYDRERWEHCERLRDREHELRDRLAYAPRYGEERERLEHRLREVHYERERCRGR